MKKRKIVSLLLATTLSTSMLAGCANTNTERVTDTKQSPALEQVIEEQALENRNYEPYEHVFFKRYYISNMGSSYYSEKKSGGQIEIPEGYEILEIENFTEKIGYGSQTAGFDVWFINNKPVEVKSVYNNSLGIYDYSEPGVVVEQELEETGPSLTLTP